FICEEFEISLFLIGNYTSNKARFSPMFTILH
ncbi:MAG: hypothetical protein ACI8VI_001696, partial [Granulosicoccus sp.]